ncbi:hypothetical protein OC834_007706, partial [Tilletia horrida]
TAHDALPPRPPLPRRRQRSPRRARRRAHHRHDALVFSSSSTRHFVRPCRKLCGAGSCVWQRIGGTCFLVRRGQLYGCCGRSDAELLHFRHRHVYVQYHALGRYHQLVHTYEPAHRLSHHGRTPRRHTTSARPLRQRLWPRRQLCHQRGLFHGSIGSGGRHAGSGGGHCARACAGQQRQPARL